MIIERVKEKKTIFKDLEVGSVFLYQGAYFMKTDEIYDGEDYCYNSVRLVTGSFEDFNFDIVVETVNAKLIIE